MASQATRRSRFIAIREVPDSFRSLMTTFTAPPVLRGQPTRKFEEPSHARVSDVRAGVHHRAGAGDDADIVLAAVLDRFRRDARTLPYRLMHPDAANAGRMAVADDPLGGFRPRDDHHAVDAARNRLQVRIAALAIEGRQVRVDGDDVVAGLLEALVDQIADRVAAPVPRHTSHRDALLREEVVNPGIERR